MLSGCWSHRRRRRRRNSTRRRLSSASTEVRRPPRERRGRGLTSSSGGGGLPAVWCARGSLSEAAPFLRGLCTMQSGLFSHHGKKGAAFFQLSCRKKGAFPERREKSPVWVKGFKFSAVLSCLCMVDITRGALKRNGRNFSLICISVRRSRSTRKSGGF